MLRYSYQASDPASGSPHIFSTIVRRSTGFDFAYVEYNKNSTWPTLRIISMSSGSSGGATIAKMGSLEQPVYFPAENTVAACSYGISADANGHDVGVIYFR
jgi:hypothetical protein